MYTLAVAFIGMMGMFIVYAKNGSLFCVSGIFDLVWTLCLGLSTLGLYGMNKPSGVVVFLGCMSILIFSIMSNLKIKIRVTINIVNKARDNEAVPISFNRGLYLVNILAYIFSMPYLVKSLAIIIQSGITSGLYQVRTNAFSGNEAFASTAVLTIFQTVIAPLFVVMILLTTLDIGRGFLVKRSIAFSLINVVLYTVLFAGRYMLFEALLFLVFASYEKYAGKIFEFIKKEKQLSLAQL